MTSHLYVQLYADEDPYPNEILWGSDLLDVPASFF
jgi:hypothetical protein